MSSRTFAKELAAMFYASGMRVMTPHETDSVTTFPEELRRLIADNAARFHSVRIRRGMASQLERGYMVSAIAFGYRAERAVLQGGRDVGTVWTVCEAEAVLIREMYARREAGESLRNLAGWLNEAGIAPPGGGPRMVRIDGCTHPFEPDLPRVVFSRAALGEGRDEQSRPRVPA